jgi:hypothetical protein
MESIQVADWPRETTPEHRIEYLIDARRDFKDQVRWAFDGNSNSGLKGFTDELLLTINRSDDGYLAFASYREGGDDFITVPLCVDLEEARLALTDLIIVEWAVLQAWADVAG